MYDRMMPTEAVAADGKHVVELNVKPARSSGEASSFSTMNVSSSIESQSIDLADSKHIAPDLRYKDVGFAVAFWVNVVATLLAAIFLGIPALVKVFGATEKNATSTAVPPLAIDGPSIVPEKDDDFYPILKWISMNVLVALSLTGIALNDFILGLRKHSTRTIQVATFTASALLLLSSCALYMLSSSSIVRTTAAAAGVIWTVVLWWRPLRTLVPFLRATINSVCCAVLKSCCVILISVGSTLVFMVWTAIWAVSVAGIASLHGAFALGSDVGSSNVLAHSFLLLWAGQVLKDAVHFTAAAAVGAWALVHSNKYEGSLAVRDALSRATRNSFGTICVAALVRTIAKTLVDATNHYGHQSFMVCLALRLSPCIVDGLRVFNAYAIVYSALYNSDYLTSVSQVLFLFKRVGLKGFVFDFLFVQVLRLLQVAAAALTGLLGLTWLVSSRVMTGIDRAGGGGGGGDSDSDNAALVTSIAMALGAGVGVGFMLTNSILFVSVSAARTIFVCLAEQPHRFANAHPDLYGKLSEAAQKSAWAQPSPCYSPAETQDRTDEEEGPEKVQ